MFLVSSRGCMTVFLLISHENKFAGMNAHQWCDIVGLWSGSAETVANTVQLYLFLSSEVISLIIDWTAILRGSAKASAFIIARCTEGSTDYLLQSKIWSSVSPGSSGAFCCILIHILLCTIQRKQKESLEYLPTCTLWFYTFCLCKLQTELPCWLSQHWILFSTSTGSTWMVTVNNCESCKHGGTCAMNMAL